MYKFEIAIDIQTVHTTFHEKIKNILMNKQDDNNNTLLSTRDYGYLVEQVRNQKCV
jgi:hypothetical protein